MIARSTLTADQVRWNRRWRAPYGRFSRFNRLNRQLNRPSIPRWLQPYFWGPFGFQPDNNRTRIAEYPWAFLATTLEPGMLAVDLGGSLGGFQFTVARAGVRVINVDPGDAAAHGWPVSEKTVRRLNRAFRTDVELRRVFLQDAGIPEASADRVFCISTIEHIPQAELPSLMAEIGRILKPGGKAVITVDLFLDLAPFTSRSENIHGTNVKVSDLATWSGLQLEQGNPGELYGFPEFDPERVQASLTDYLWGDVGPCVAQCFVLSK